MQFTLLTEKLFHSFKKYFGVPISVKNHVKKRIG